MARAKSGQVPIHVVFQVKDLRETGAGGFVFGPGTVGVLGVNKILDAATKGFGVGVAEGAEGHHRPGGLGSGARPLAFEDRIVVSVAAFAPAAIGVLDAFEPVAGFEEPRLVHVEIERAQSAQDLPGAVDVSSRPSGRTTSRPPPVVADEVERLFHLRIVQAIIFVAEQFQNARGDVGAFGVEHGVVIRERNFFQDALGADLCRTPPSRRLCTGKSSSSSRPR